MAKPRRKRKQRILIVDDLPMTRKVFQYMLDKDYAVRTASTEGEALEHARLTRFDLILMDIHLGTERTGIDAMDALRCLPGYENVPIVALTAYGLEGAREHLMSIGFDEFVAKPCKRADLTRLIEYVLQEAARPNRPAVCRRPPTNASDNLFKADWIRWPS